MGPLPERVNIATQAREPQCAVRWTTAHWGRLAGAVAAAATVYVLVEKTFALVPAAPASTTAALLAGMQCTFALALVVLNVAVSERTCGNCFWGLAIRCTSMVAAFAAGPLVPVAPSMIFPIQERQHRPPG